MLGMSSILTFIITLIILYAGMIGAPPAPTKTTPSPEEDLNQDQNFGLYYDEYLREVINLLESDENFRVSMEKADFEDIKSGKLSDEVRKIPIAIREKLDALKREELSRLRKILRVKMDSDQGIKPYHSAYLKNIAQHLDSSNPHSFGAQDLTNLIKAASTDLENYDLKRHQDFKNYEMMKDMKRMEKLKEMNDNEKKKAESEYQEMRRKHVDHPKVNHPGSKAQLDEVWREKDGLIDEAFDPKTFFVMHDLNGDNALDPSELEALFDKELSKVYDEKNAEDDMVERDEERRRMRQHVTEEVDKDKDGLVSLKEFLEYSKTDDFENPDDDSYKSVDELIEENDIYTIEELEEYRQMVLEHEDELKKKLNDIQKKSASIAEMRENVSEHEQRLGANPPEHEKQHLENKKQQIEEEEEALDEMKADADEHREELSDMKQDLEEQENALKDQELAVKIDEQISDVVNEQEDMNSESHELALQIKKEIE